ncbi:hypothetical protein NHX12_023135 [Muraenolepis orangiensis]|uniref:PLA2c domain-containing protein n=1 Tax=Muraenolepis orangiensis TaxID=630683 RepID=A0A9Q0ELK9_9TELE|nr:hypothetical protein NHX12_023135 [Muraenolepis orangiensis]
MKELKGHKGYQLLSTLVDLHLDQHTGGDSTPLLQTANALLTGMRDLDGLVIQLNLDAQTDRNEQTDKHTSAICQSFFDYHKDLDTEKKPMSGRDLTINKDDWVKSEPQSLKTHALGVARDIGHSIFNWFPDIKSATWEIIVKKLLYYVKKMLNSLWIWGTNYNYLFNMSAPHLDKELLKSETSHFEDAGLLVNSPYMSVLRAEREIDLIISFDFSEGDAMETVTKTAAFCKDFGISFPEINVKPEDQDSPKSFYVFKGLNKAPTVIHMPLFNVENCGSELDHYKQKFRTFQGVYTPEMIKDLVEKASENVNNNKENLWREIRNRIECEQVDCYSN